MQGLMFRFKIFSFCLLLAGSLAAQEKVVLKITDSATVALVTAATISSMGKNIGISNDRGIAIISLPTGKHTINVSSVEYGSRTVSVIIPYQDTLRIFLPGVEAALESVTVVASTRTNQRIENATIKVEVLNQEDMEEESALKPAGIGSILGDVSGVQIQQSSAINGNANVRIQGLEGRYTQILKDGLPLFDGFSGGFGILSIPPLDLKQVELIKGSASTLYGGGAIGGLVNIISRTPVAKQELVFSVNETTLQETNFNTYAAKKFKKIGYTFFGGYNTAKPADVNNDGFSDVSFLNGIVLHPRVFLYPNTKTTITLGYTGTFEKRNGGDMQVLKNKGDMIHAFFENNNIQRNSFELLAKTQLGKKSNLEFKNSYSIFNRKLNTNTYNFTGRQKNFYNELSLFVPYKKSSIVTGINFMGNEFLPLSTGFSLPSYQTKTLGAFIQHTIKLNAKTTLEAGLRDDYNYTYGNFILPRISVFHRFNKYWASRAGIGFGYKQPDPLSVQNKDYSLNKIQPLPMGIQAEKSTGYNAEANYTYTFGEGNRIFINQAFFFTSIQRPVVAREDINGNVFFFNESNPTVSKGSDTYISAKFDEWELYAGYTLTIATREYLSVQKFVTYTPKHRIASTIVKEWEDYGLRFGLEASYTGPQHRDNYSHTPGYLFAAGMVQKKFGEHFSVVINAENILDYRQSKVEPLFTGSISQPAFETLWAPIDGRILNLAIKWKL